MKTIEVVLANAASRISRFAQDRRGATAIEYAMLAAGIGAAIAATVWSLGTDLTQFYSNVSNKL